MVWLRFTRYTTFTSKGTRAVGLDPQFHVHHIWNVSPKCPFNKSHYVFGARCPNILMIPLTNSRSLLRKNLNFHSVP
jgi:hypothetical protein